MELDDIDTELEIFADEPTEEDLIKEEQEEFFSVRAWNIIKCRHCNNFFDIVTSKWDREGNVLCRKCGHRN